MRLTQVKTKDDLIRHLIEQYEEKQQSLIYEFSGDFAESERILQEHIEVLNKLAKEVK